MRGQIKKWGNSLAVRLPKTIAEDTQLKEGSAVEFKLQNGRLVIAHVPTALALSELLKHINKHNLHQELDFGLARGKELW